MTQQTGLLQDHLNLDELQSTTTANGVGLALLKFRCLSLQNPHDGQWVRSIELRAQNGLLPCLYRCHETGLQKEADLAYELCVLNSPHELQFRPYDDQQYVYVVHFVEEAT